MLMKKITALSAALLLCVCLFGCARANAPSMPDTTEGYTFTDDLGRSVTVRSIDRVAALLGSYADIWYLAGGTVCAAADDAWTDFSLPLAADAVNLGGTKALSLEKLLAADPDFVLASLNTPQHLEWRSALEGAGIATAYFDVPDFDGYLYMLEICTALTGESERFAQYGIAVRDRIDAVFSRHDGEPLPGTALVLRASAASIRAKNSSSTVLGEMFKSFGGVNIADRDDTLLESLSVESIVLQNPYWIFIIEAGDDAAGIRKNVETLFRENPLWGELDAVKNGRVYYMDKHLYNFKPNARWAEAFETLEKILYASS